MDYESISQLPSCVRVNRRESHQRFIHCDKSPGRLAQYLVALNFIDMTAVGIKVNISFLCGELFF